MEVVIRYTHYVGESILLGPYRRGVLWTNGCNRKCSGCLAEEMMKKIDTTKTVVKFIEFFSQLDGIEGLTISGGEPFLQSQALSKLMEGLREIRDYGLIVYTGYEYEQLETMAKTDEDVGKFLAHIDLLIDGPYVKELDDNRPYIGSSNQRLIHLTKRYTEVAKQYYIEGKRKSEIRVESDGVFMIGVPSKKGLETWKKVICRFRG